MSDENTTSTTETAPAPEAPTPEGPAPSEGVGTPGVRRDALPDADASVKAIFEHDYFGPSAEPEQGSGEPKPSTPPKPTAAPTPAAPGQKPPEAAPPAPPAAPLAGPEPAPEVKALRDELETLRAQVAANAPKPAPQAPPEVQLPEYNFTLPKEMVDLLGSEDPAQRSQGLQAFARGIARGTHHQVVTEMRKELASVLPMLIAQNVTGHSERQKIRSDFYGKYPEFDSDDLRPMVDNVARQVAKETGAKGWTPDLRDKIALRMRAIAQGIIPGPAPAAPQVPAPAPQPKPPGFIGSGTRPAIPQNLSDVQRDILDIMH